MSKAYTISLIVAVLLLSVIGSSAAADDPNDILVVANFSVAEKSINPDDLRKIFLKKRKSWSGGGKVVPINAKAGSDLREQFLKRMLEMTSEEERSYWEIQKIKKGIEPPPEFSNNLKAVFHIKGSISYVFRNQYREGVSKILYILPR